MKTKNRPKSRNIEDRRIPKKIRNNNDTVVVPRNDGTYGGMTEKGMFKDRADLASLKRPRYSKRKKKNLAANSSSKKRMSKAR
jgi:hypothetical protein